MTPWGEAEVWDAIAARMEPREFAHIFVWDHEYRAWEREQREEHPFDWAKEGL